MKYSRLYIAGLITMLLMNGVLIFLLLQKPMGPPKRSASGPNKLGNVKELIHKQLEFDDNQIRQFEVLAKEHFEGLRAVSRKQKDVARRYFSQLKESETDTALTQSLLDELQLIESEKLILTFSHFEDIKALCTPEQLSRFDSIVDEMMVILLNDQRNMPPPPRGARDN